MTASITSTLFRHVRMGQGDRPAITLEDEGWTYAELAAATGRTANALIALGIGRGDRVAILLKNSLEYWSTYLAIVGIGAIAVRLNWRLAPSELAYALADSTPRALFGHPDLLAANATAIVADDDLMVVVVDTPVTPAVPGTMTLADLLYSHDTAFPAVEPISADDPCMIMYTSGTTGFPKGARWTHGNTLWFAAMQAAHWRFGADTVHFSTGPMFHVGGFEDWCLPTLLAGGHLLVLRSRAFSIDRVIELCHRHGVTEVGLFPAMIHELLARDGLGPDALGQVRCIYTGGSPILLSAVHRLRALFPDVELQQTYGLTEGGGIATVMDGASVEAHPSSVGRPLPFAEIRIARLDDERVDAARGEDGHLWVRSPAVCGNYYGKPEATAETFVDGWCRTGDVARLTDDFFLYITGRVKDMIISGGENIYPVEIENVIAEHPAVRDVAVIGMPDDKWGETPCAVVVVRAGAALLPADVIAHVASRLAGYKKPRHVRFIDELPRNAAGKVLKRVLREHYIAEQREKIA